MSEKNPVVLSDVLQKLTEEIQKDPSLLNRLSEDPVKTVEALTGLDLPDEQVNKLLEMLKKEAANIDLTKVDFEKVGNTLDFLKKFIK